MAAIPLTTPYSMDNCTLGLGAVPDTYEASITGATFTPAAGTVVRTIDGGKVVGNANWTLVVGLVQDADANGFLRFLLDNEGAKLPATFTPIDGSDPVTTDVIIAPGAIGSATVGAPAQSTVTLECTRPTWEPPI